MQLIRGKHAVVTGGGSGLGRSLCLQLAARGIAVAVADIDLQRARETVAQMQDADAAANSFAVTCDVSQEHGFEKIKNEIRSHWDGHLALLINNAGVASAGGLLETDEAQWQRLIGINLLGVARGCRQLLPLMMSGPDGHVVNVASFAGLACAPGMVTYNVSKAGVIALSESLRGELQAHGIGVSVACPAFFKTRLLDTFSGPEGVVGRVEKMMQRSKVQADDVAGDIISAIEKNQFMVISHPQARHAYRLKRWFPKRFFTLISAQAQRWRAQDEARDHD